jgi:hypothetical protein
VSDLQCPARIFLLRRGAADVGAVVEHLEAERLAAVLDSGAAVDLAEVADRHRGETVLVVAEHRHATPLVLVEIDADGRRVSPWEMPCS